MRTINYESAFKRYPVWALRYAALMEIGKAVSKAWAAVYDDTDYETDELELDNKASEKKDMIAMQKALARILAVIHNEEQDEKRYEEDDSDTAIDIIPYVMNDVDAQSPVDPIWQLRYHALLSIDTVLEDDYMDFEENHEIEDDELYIITNGETVLRNKLATIAEILRIEDDEEHKYNEED